MRLHSERKMVWFKSRGWNFSMPSWLSGPRGQQAFTVLTSTQSAVTRRISSLPNFLSLFSNLLFKPFPPKYCFSEETLSSGLGDLPMTRENIKSFPFQLFFFKILDFAAPTLSRCFLYFKPDLCTFPQVVSSFHVSSWRNQDQSGEKMLAWPPA